MNMASQGMIRLTVLACIGLIGWAGPRWSEGQTPPPAPAGAADTSASHSSAQSEAGEPRATTSPDAPSAGSPGADPAGAHEEASRTGRRAPSAKAADRAEGTGKAEERGKVDKLELKTATVTGDREQPKVLYIVPWKRSDIGDLSGKPINSLLDEALRPVDRDEFKREVTYYQAIRADASQNGAADKGSAGGQARPR